MTRRSSRYGQQRDQVPAWAKSTPSHPPSLPHPGGAMALWAYLDVHWNETRLSFDHTARQGAIPRFNHRYWVKSAQLFSYWKSQRVLDNLSRDEEKEPEPRVDNHNQGFQNHSRPKYFDSIDTDLRPWKDGGITKSSLSAARRKGSMRMVISQGKLYIEVYGKCPQSRSIFTAWGLLLLLERFPGKVPDVDFVLNCKDRPEYLAIVCRPEVDIPPWEEQSQQITAGSREVKWSERRPAAFWKGNSRMGKLRRHLLQCQSLETEILDQDWISESRAGFPNSRLSQQCKDRFNIYVEGAAWSASLKYRMACGSTMLNVESKYREFFSAGLIPNLTHLAISANPDTMCQEIQAAVKWGNSHPLEAEAIGRHGQDFITKELTMDHVYRYMLELISQYAKLQRFTPTIPHGAQILCKDAIKHLTHTATNF
ncbi:O-glucosyltransferase rumi homolog [Selaginella moellendorffii]|uniref:O-glucosyltransferase rumi homolog n=1 Tax=Selaginella moellendorffii TaxID=88036 RepID=UPI000D1CBFB0|nr:O-glucosyltransferase rumi homolog [Selaginella moellendorffii]|eukprot:XP_024524828.1 O-glucosyltransferase rumi homolog [Selaginella moellendorffii]